MQNANVTSHRAHRAIGALILMATLSASGSTLAEDPAEPAGVPPQPAATPIVDDRTLVANGAVIGDIVIHAGDIFDTESEEENKKLFRLANKLHRNTRDGVIRRILLFKSGDPFSRSVIEESERALRQAAYLYDAKIELLRYEDNRVDVSVETRDVWTLEGGISFGRSGGTNSARIKLEEKNLLGWGKAVEFRHSTNVDRTSTLLAYRDTNLFGGRSQLGLGYSDNSDGQSHLFDLSRPFVSLDSRWSAGVRFGTDNRVDSLYALGEISEQFAHDEQLAEVYGGLSRGLHNHRTVRWSAGFTYKEDRFGPPGDYREIGLIPEDRTLAFPWIEFATVQDRFIELNDLDKIQRTEDFNLGREIRARVGYAAKAFGSDRDQTVVDASYSSGYVPGTGQLMLVEGHAGGRLGASGEENAIVGGSLRYLMRDWNRHVLAFSLTGDLASNLDAENQMTLGGDNGLRGYPLRYQEGDRRVLFTVEQRFYTDWHVFKLFRVGAAVFADIGRAWFEGANQSNIDIDGPLRDVGFGLRLSSSRSSRASMLHLDLAMPLDGDPSISKVQFLVTTGDRF